MSPLLKKLKAPLKQAYLAHVTSSAARKANIDIRRHNTFFELSRGNDAIRIGRQHLIYMTDVIGGFDYYFGAVEPVHTNGKNLVDYSTPRFHQVKGFDLFPVMFNGFAEPLVTTRQYLEIAQIPKGGTVLDLGGYSGLTSMLFALDAGREGRVICVEADKYNQASIQANVAYFGKLNQDAAPIVIEEKAVWTHNNGVTFSTDGNMGSTVADIFSRGEIIAVPSITLSEIVRQHGLTRLDFIKCDVEGAEAYIFNHERELLQKFRPRIIIESHRIGDKLSTDAFRPHLEAAGYELTEIVQHGAPLPLVIGLPSRGHA